MQRVEKFITALQKLSQGEPFPSDCDGVKHVNLGGLFWFMTENFYIENGNSTGLHIATIEDAEGLKKLYYSEKPLPKKAVFHFTSNFRIIERLNGTLQEPLSEVKNELSKSEIGTLNPLPTISLHPLVLPNGGLGMLSGKPKIGKSSILACLLNEIVLEVPFTILYFSLDEDDNFVRLRISNYSPLNTYNAFHIFSKNDLLMKYNSVFLTVDILKTIIGQFPNGKLFIVVDSLLYFYDFFMLSKVKNPVSFIEKIVELNKTLGERGATLLLINHLTKISNKLDVMNEISVVDYLDAVAGNTSLIAIFDYHAIIRPCQGKRELRQVSIIGRHLQGEITLFYEPILTSGGIIYKRCKHQISSEYQQVLSDAEVVTFMELLNQKTSTTFAEICKEVAQKLNKGINKLYDRLYKKTLRKDNRNSLVSLGLISVHNNLIYITDLGKLALTAHKKEISNE